MAGLDERTDRELLKAFADVRDEAAFVELVRRHGPLVWSVCRRVLGRSADAEDAVQAAFLALAQQASRGEAIRALAPWLHRVGHDIAVNQLKSRRARERREKEAAMLNLRVEEPAGLSDEQGALLHQEIDALPQKYRQAVVLCHLEGMSLEQAATVMACPKATLGTWAARGRERLRSRLAQRGLILSLAALTSLLSAEAGAAELPAAFATSTATAAALFVEGNAGGMGAGMLSSGSALLAKGALRRMAYAKLRWVTCTVVLMVCIAGGSGWLVSRATSAEGEGNGQGVAPKATPAPPANPANRGNGAEKSPQPAGQPYRFLLDWPVDPIMQGWQKDATGLATVIQNEEDLKNFYAKIRANPVYKIGWRGEIPDQTFEKALTKHGVDTSKEALVFLRCAAGPDDGIFMKPVLKNGVLTCTVSQREGGGEGPKTLIARLSTVAIAVKRGEITEVVFEQSPVNKESKATIHK